jgi:GNAT superfamily N-acetyltransferase
VTDLGRATTPYRAVAAHPVQLKAVLFDEPEVQQLVAEVQAYYVTIYGGPDDSPIDHGEFTPPAGQFVLARDDEGPVATGGWRLRPDLDERFEARTAEVKRMYVTPRARRRGISRLVLAELEATAAAAGVTMLVLETGVVQQDAIALYTTSGYTRTVDFGHYADSDLSRCYAKRLPPATTVTGDDARG